MSLKEFNPAIKYGHLVATDEIEFDQGIPFTATASCGSINCGGNAGNALGVGGSTTVALLSDATVLSYGTPAFNSARQVFITGVVVYGPTKIWTTTNTLTNFRIEDTTGTVYFSWGSAFTASTSSVVVNTPYAYPGSASGTMLFGAGSYTGGTHNKGIRVSASGTCATGNNFTVTVSGIIK